MACRLNEFSSSRFPQKMRKRSIPSNECCWKSPMRHSKMVRLISNRLKQITNTKIAGLKKEDVYGSDTSVYVGSFVKGKSQRQPPAHPQQSQTQHPNTFKTTNKYVFETLTGLHNMPLLEMALPSWQTGYRTSSTSTDLV